MFTYVEVDITVLSTIITKTYFLLIFSVLDPALFTAFLARDARSPATFA